MTTVEYDEEKIQDYENLQAKYKELLEEYEDIKSKDSSSANITEKVKEMTEIQKKIQDLASKLS
ncbi:MAG: hypothetical protein K5777_05085 [Nitrosopumilus sp.]|nr:hypothetical protein [Nitrosopumilus sp.]